LHHDRQQFEVLCYANVGQSDALTDRFRVASDGWRNIAGISDEEAAARIRADRIDILVDLTLHLANHRLLVFARRPAPVQVTWAGYPGTTGLETIDYRLTDPYLDPPGTSDEHYSEASICLPHSFWCYDPLTGAPPVNPLPALISGHITFGSLNNYCKVHEGVLELWAKVLGIVPDSRLLLLSKVGVHRQRAIEVFERCGVAGERIEWFTPAARPEYLAAYHRIDVGLDTFPYNGHTTSLDSFWMGVPVITLVGKTVVGRGGLSQAMNLGLPELIARTREEYVQRAAELASDLPRLAELRQSLRARMQASPLMDAARFTRDLEAAYRDMWCRWCARPEC
jgi:predicted O-linked N-acetylglucosamine transferase (SPINDLY family)